MMSSRAATSPIYDVGMATAKPGIDLEPGSRDSFIESLMDTDLYSMGAFFCDEHPELVDEVVSRSTAIEKAGLEGYASDQGISVEEGFRTLLTGLAVRYYKAVAS